jgi:hypothetical protein
MNHLSAASSFRRFSLLTLLLAFGTTGAALAQSKPPTCPLSPDALKKVFGVGFGAGKAEPGISGGTGCIYVSQGGSQKNNTDLSVSVFIDPPMGAPDMHRKMTMGPMHQFLPVAGDADKAVTVKHGGSVSPFPQVSYERGGYIVKLHLTGLAFEADAKARDARLEQMNRKLLQLPRVP